MHNHIVKAITTAAAASVSALAVALAVASASQRAAASHDQMLLAALSVVIVLAVHLLPALLNGRQRLIMWPVWALCFCLASFGHASWFYRAGEDAAAARAARSVAAVALLKEREAITQALDTIKARPVATVAAQIARTTDQNRREALAQELAEAKRAAGMRDRLVSPIAQQPVQSSGGLAVDEVAKLRAAIARGECRATVQSIRGYMGCKTDTAARLRCA